MNCVQGSGCLPTSPMGVLGSWPEVLTDDFFRRLTSRVNKGYQTPQAKIQQPPSLSLSPSFILTPTAVHHLGRKEKGRSRPSRQAEQSSRDKQDSSHPAARSAHPKHPHGDGVLWGFEYKRPPQAHVPECLVHGEGHHEEVWLVRGSVSLWSWGSEVTLPIPFCCLGIKM